MNKKLFASKLYSRSGLYKIIKNNNNGEIIIFNYHRIAVDGCEKKFSDDVYGLNIVEFERNIKWINKNTDVLSESELLSLIDRGSFDNNTYSLITFDDGYIDNYTHAFPILKKYNIPSILFVPTKQITSQELGWWDVISYFVKNTSKSEITVRDKRYPLCDRSYVINEFYQLMKLDKSHTTEGLLDDLSRACDVVYPSNELQSAELMTWEDVIDCQRYGVTIGSHTVTHRVLATLPLNEQAAELQRSKTIIEEKLGQCVNSLSYPVGYYDHFTSETKQLAKEAGYKLAFSFNTGMNNRANIDYYDMKRIVGLASLDMIKSQVSLPGVFI